MGVGRLREERAAKRALSGHQPERPHPRADRSSTRCHGRRVGSDSGVRSDEIPQFAPAVGRRGPSAPSAGQTVALLAGQRSRTVDGPGDVLSAHRPRAGPRRPLRHRSLHRRGGAVPRHTRRTARRVRGPLRPRPTMHARRRRLLRLRCERVLGQRGHLGDAETARVAGHAVRATVVPNGAHHSVRASRILRPPWATEEQIRTEIARNAGQFAVVTKGGH